MAERVGATQDTPAGDARVTYGAKPKTSAAAVFSLVFGLSAVFTALLAFLAPLAVVFGLIGLLLAVVAFKMVRRLHVTGRGVALAGLILSILGLVLGIALLVGAAFFVNEGGLNRLEQRMQRLRENIPSELPNVDVQGGDVNLPQVEVQPGG